MKWCSVSQIWSKPSSSVHSICSSSRCTTSAWLSPGAAWKKKNVPKRMVTSGPRYYTPVGECTLKLQDAGGPQHEESSKLDLGRPDHPVDRHRVRLRLAWGHSPRFRGEHPAQHGASPRHRPHAPLHRCRADISRHGLGAD